MRQRESGWTHVHGALTGSNGLGGGSENVGAARDTAVQRDFVLVMA